MRLDVWLWRARLFRSRTLASQMLASGSARVEHAGRVQRIERAAALVAAGDIITFPRGHAVETLEVLALPTRRGPAAEAAACYRRPMAKAAAITPASTSSTSPDAARAADRG